MDETRRKQQRVEVNLRVSLKYPDRTTFVERFSINVSRTGLFVRAKDPLPIGSRVRFEYRIADNTCMLRGTGVVRWARKVTESSAESPPGMGIEFTGLDAESEELITHIIATQGEGVRAPKARNETQNSGAPSEPKTRASLPQVGSSNGHDTALDAIDALGGSGSSPSVTNTPPSERIIDLTGTDLLVALLGGDTTNRSRSHERRVPVRADESGQLVPEGGHWLPQLLAWFEPPAATAKFHAMARRLGWSLDSAQSGRIQIGATSINPQDVLREVLEKAVIPTQEAGRVENTTVVLPITASTPTRNLALQLLSDLGIPKPAVTTDAEIILSSAAVALGPGERATVIHLTPFEARISLFEGPDQIVATQGDMSAGLWDSDELVSEKVSWTLLREHGIDISESPELQNAVSTQTREHRCTASSNAPWAYSCAGATVDIDGPTLERWCAPLSERIALLTHALQNTQGANKSLDALVVLGDEKLWPGMLSTLRTLIHPSPTLVHGEEWLRIGGVSRKH